MWSQVLPPGISSSQCPSGSASESKPVSAAVAAVLSLPSLMTSSCIIPAVLKVPYYARCGVRAVSGVLCCIMNARARDDSEYNIVA
jgi:hypothetical protein